MLGSAVKCPIPDIPGRLHSKGRSSVNSLYPKDWLYMRHPPRRGFWYGSYIPGHDHLADQSANSKILNNPAGHPRDVLYDESGKPHHWDWGITGFSVRQLNELALPNPNTLFRKVKGQPVGPDVYTFRVDH